MRAHARVEDHIQRLKNSGLERMPFTNFDANSAWTALVCWSDILVRWFQRLVCTGPLARANPKRMRWQLWHTPARLIRTARRDVIRLLDHWPGTATLLDAYTRINAITLTRTNRRAATGRNSLNRHAPKPGQHPKSPSAEY